MSVGSPAWPIECVSTVDSKATLPGTAEFHKWNVLIVEKEATLPEIAECMETAEGALTLPEQGGVPIHRSQCSHY